MHTDLWLVLRSRVRCDALPTCATAAARDAAAGGAKVRCEPCDDTAASVVYMPTRAMHNSQQARTPLTPLRTAAAATLRAALTEKRVAVRASLHELRPVIRRAAAVIRRTRWCTFLRS
jgi:hypothetical protein